VFGFYSTGMESTHYPVHLLSVNSRYVKVKVLSHF